LLAADLDPSVAVFALHHLEGDAFGFLLNFLVTPADETLGRVDGVLRIGNRLPLRDRAD